MHKPSDADYDQFWVDFNTSSGRIVIFIEPNFPLSQSQGGETMWETVSLSKLDIARCDFSVSGTLGKAVIELKPGAQIYSSVEPDNQPHLAVLLISTEYPLNQALAETFDTTQISTQERHKSSAVKTPVSITNPNATKTMPTNKNQAPHKPTQHGPAQSSNRDISCSQQSSQRRGAKTSVPLIPMTTPASSVVSSSCESQDLSWQQVQRKQAEERHLRAELNKVSPVNEVSMEKGNVQGEHVESLRDNSDNGAHTSRGGLELSQPTQGGKCSIAARPVVKGAVHVEKVDKSSTKNANDKSNVKNDQNQKRVEKNSDLPDQAHLGKVDYLRKTDLEIEPYNSSQEKKKKKKAEKPSKQKKACSPPEPCENVKNTESVEKQSTSRDINQSTSNTKRNKQNTQNGSQGNQGNQKSNRRSIPDTQQAENLPEPDETGNSPSLEGTDDKDHESCSVRRSQRSSARLSQTSKQETSQGKSSQDETSTKTQSGGKKGKTPCEVSALTEKKDLQEEAPSHKPSEGDHGKHCGKGSTRVSSRSCSRSASHTEIEASVSPHSGGGPELEHSGPRVSSAPVTPPTRQSRKKVKTPVVTVQAAHKGKGAPNLPTDSETLPASSVEAQQSRSFNNTGEADFNQDEMVPEPGVTSASKGKKTRSSKDRNTASQATNANGSDASNSSKAKKTERRESAKLTKGESSFIAQAMKQIGFSPGNVSEEDFKIPKSFQLLKRGKEDKKKKEADLRKKEEEEKRQVEEEEKKKKEEEEIKKKEDEKRQVEEEERRKEEEEEIKKKEEHESRNEEKERKREKQDKRENEMRKGEEKKRQKEDKDKKPKQKEVDMEQLEITKRREEEDEKKKSERYGKRASARRNRDKQKVEADSTCELTLNMENTSHVQNESLMAKEDNGKGSMLDKTPETEISEKDKFLSYVNESTKCNGRTQSQQPSADDRKEAELDSKQDMETSTKHCSDNAADENTSERMVIKSYQNVLENQSHEGKSLKQRKRKRSLYQPPSNVDDPKAMMYFKKVDDVKKKKAMQDPLVNISIALKNGGAKQKVQSSPKDQPTKESKECKGKELATGKTEEDENKGRTKSTPEDMIEDDDEYLPLEICDTQISEEDQMEKRKGMDATVKEASNVKHQSVTEANKDFDFKDEEEDEYLPLEVSEQTPTPEKGTTSGKIIKGAKKSSSNFGENQERENTLKMPGEKNSSMGGNGIQSNKVEKIQKDIESEEDEYLPLVDPETKISSTVKNGISKSQEENMCDDVSSSSSGFLYIEPDDTCAENMNEKRGKKGTAQQHKTASLKHKVKETSRIGGSHKEEVKKPRKGDEGSQNDVIVETQCEKLSGEIPCSQMEGEDENGIGEISSSGPVEPSQPPARKVDPVSKMKRLSQAGSVKSIKSHHCFGFEDEELNASGDFNFASVEPQVSSNVESSYVFDKFASAKSLARKPVDDKCADKSDSLTMQGDLVAGEKGYETKQHLAKQKRKGESGSDLTKCGMKRLEKNDNSRSSIAPPMLGCGDGLDLNSTNETVKSKKAAQKVEKPLPAPVRHLRERNKQISYKEVESFNDSDGITPLKLDKTQHSTPFDHKSTDRSRYWESSSRNKSRDQEINSKPHWAESPTEFMNKTQEDKRTMERVGSMAPRKKAKKGTIEHRTLWSQEVKTTVTTTSFSKMVDDGSDADPYSFEAECSTVSGDAATLLPFKTFRKSDLWQPSPSDVEKRGTGKSAQTGERSALHNKKVDLCSKGYLASHRETIYQAEGNDQHSKVTCSRRSKAVASKKKKGAEQVEVSFLSSQKSSSRVDEKKSFGKESMEYALFSSQIESRKSQSGLVFPPLEDEIPCTPYEEIAEEDDDLQYERKSNVSELSWLKNKTPAEVQQRKRGKTYRDQLAKPSRQQLEYEPSEAERESDIDPESDIGCNLEQGPLYQKLHNKQYQQKQQKCPEGGKKRSKSDLKTKDAAKGKGQVNKFESSKTAAAEKRLAKWSPKRKKKLGALHMEVTPRRSSALARLSNKFEPLNEFSDHDNWDSESVMNDISPPTPKTPAREPQKEKVISSILRSRKSFKDDVTPRPSKNLSFKSPSDVEVDTGSDKEDVADYDEPEFPEPVPTSALVLQDKQAGCEGLRAGSVSGRSVKSGSDSFSMHSSQSWKILSKQLDNQLKEVFDKVSDCFDPDKPDSPQPKFQSGLRNQKRRRDSELKRKYAGLLSSSSDQNLDSVDSDGEQGDSDDEGAPPSRKLFKTASSLRSSPHHPALQTPKKKKLLVSKSPKLVFSPLDAPMKKSALKKYPEKTQQNTGLRSPLRKKRKSQRKLELSPLDKREDIEDRFSTSNASRSVISFNLSQGLSSPERTRDVQKSGDLQLSPPLICLSDSSAAFGLSQLSCASPPSPSPVSEGELGPPSPTPPALLDSIRDDLAPPLPALSSQRSSGSSEQMCEMFDSAEAAQLAGTSKGSFRDFLTRKNLAKQPSLSGELDKATRSTARCIAARWNDEHVARHAAVSKFQHTTEAVIARMHRDVKELNQFEKDSARLWDEQRARLRKHLHSEEKELQQLKAAHEELADQLHQTHENHGSAQRAVKAVLKKDVEAFKKKLQERYNSHSLDVMKKCLQASFMFS